MRFEPGNAVERIADAGMKAMEAAAQDEGVELDDSLIFVTLDRGPEGEPNAATHPHFTSNDEPTETTVLAFACAHVQSLSKSIGIPVHLTVDVPCWPPRRR